MGRLEAALGHDPVQHRDHGYQQAVHHHPGRLPPGQGAAVRGPVLLPGLRG